MSSGFFSSVAACDERVEFAALHEFELRGEPHALVGVGEQIASVPRC